MTSRSGFRQGVRLLQDLLRDRELAEVVQAACEPHQLDVRGGQLELLRDRAGDRGHSLGMAAGVHVARVDGACEGRRGAEARDAVAAAGCRLELGEVDAPASRTWFLPCSLAQ